MKKAVFILLCLITSMATLVGCGKTKTEKVLEEKRDSIQTADSVAAVEAANIEQARQDSIQREENMRALVPQMKDLAGYDSAYGGVCFKDFSKVSRKLKQKGYNEVVKSRTIPGYEGPEGYEPPTTVKDYVWTLNSDVNIKVETGDCLVTLTFGDEKSQKIFMESMKAAGFKKGRGSYGGATNGGPNRSIKGTVYHHPKGEYYCGVWVDETPGKVYLVYTWTY